MRGDLSETSVADLCRGLSTVGATGAVEVGDHAGDARIFFRAGDVYWAVSPTPRARLGDRLVNGGLLTQEQLDEVLAAQRDSTERTKLGALLVERGLVSRDVIRVFVQEQILDALLEMMGWHAGPYVFNAGEAVDEKLPVDIPVDQLLVEVSRRQNEWDQIQEAIPDLDMIPDFVTGGSSANAALEPDEFTVLANVDGDRSIRDLAEDLGYSEFEAARIVYGLTLLGIVDVRPGERAGDDVDVDVATALEEAITAADLPRVPPPTDHIPRPSVKLHVDDDVRDYLPPAGSPVTPAPTVPDEADEADEADETDETDEIEPWVAGDDAQEAPTPPSDVGFFADAPASATSDPGAGTEGGTAPLDDDDFDALLDELATPLETPGAGRGGEEPPRDEPAADPEPVADEPAADPEPVAEAPARPAPPARRGPSGGQGGGGDVSEFLRELSQLAIDEPPPSGKPSPAKPRPREPASEAAEAAASSREEEQRRQAEEKREAANKKRGLFGWGR